jgi:hypothetical protein
MTLVLLFLTTCFVAYSNGANDNFKGVASLFGSRTCNYRTAIFWATITTFAGSIMSIFLAQTLLKTWPRFHGKSHHCDSGRAGKFVWAARFDNARFGWFAFRNRPNHRQRQSPDRERDCSFVAGDVAVCRNRGRVRLLARGSDFVIS